MSPLASGAACWAPDLPDSERKIERERGRGGGEQVEREGGGEGNRSDYQLRTDDR